MQRWGEHRERVRLLIVSDEMEVGGTQRQIVNIALGLDRHTFDVTVLYFRNRSSFVDELEGGGVRVIELPKRGSVDLPFLLEFRALLATGRFDVMHCFSLSGEVWGAVAHTLLRPGRRPALLTSVRGTYEWYGWRDWAVKRWVSLKSKHVIANSRMGAQYACRKMRLRDDAIDVVYNGVRPSHYSAQDTRELRASLNVSDTARIVAFVGRLVDHKDLGTLLRAVRRLVDERPDLRVLIAGDGPLRGEVERQTASLQLNQTVMLLGHREDATSLIEIADMLVLCSLREGLSNVILESMMAAKPVVASRAGGNVELVKHESTGLLFDIGDDAALASAISRLLDDRALCARMGSAGHARAQSEFSVPAMISSMQRLYMSATGTRFAQARLRGEVGESV